MKWVSSWLSQQQSLTPKFKPGALL